MHYAGLLNLMSFFFQNPDYPETLLSPVCVCELHLSDCHCRQAFLKQCGTSSGTALIDKSSCDFLLKLCRGGAALLCGTEVKEFF